MDSQVDSQIKDGTGGDAAPGASPCPVTPGTGMARRTGAQRTLGRIDIFEDLGAAGAAWSELESICPASVYQSRRFLLPWLATHGAAKKITPMIVVARDTTGSPVALLPFGVQRSGAVQIAGFLGGADSNANVGLFRPDIHFSADDLLSLLRAAARKAPRQPDLFVLVNQPDRFAGGKNPLNIFPHQPSASFCHSGRLETDPQAFFARQLSRETAKKLRKKRKRLEAMGRLAYVRPQSGAEVAHGLDAFFALKLARFRQQHIVSDFEHPQARSYLERACCPRPDRAAAIDLHLLQLDERIIAIFAGSVHRGHLHLMFNAFDTDAEIAKSSPGELLLQTLLEQACSDGVASFDLGIGEARYKDTWCEHAEPMFDSVLAISALGHAYSAAESTRRRLKRVLKQNRWLWPLTQVLMRRG